MDLDKIERLIRMLESSSLIEIEIEEDGLRMRMQKAQALAPQPAAIPLIAQPVQTTVPVTAAPAAPGEAAVAEPDVPTIDSPMVGTFYSAPTPGDPPFVQVGDQVEDGQMVCIVEAMKLMNDVTSKLSCIIEKVLVENGEPVEFGQPLFAIRPVEQV